VKPAVLHVIKTLELGGAETNLRSLMRHFDMGKYEHHIAYSFGGELEKVFAGMPDVRLYKFSEKKHKNSSPMSLVIIAKLAAYIFSKKIRVVHTHNFNAHFWGAYAAKLAGAKLVEHVHDFRYFEPAELERRKGGSNLNRHIAKFKGMSDRVIVLTEQNRRFLIEKGFYPAEKVRIIPNGIPIPPDIISKRREVAEQFGYPEDAPMVLVPIRLAPTKNPALALRIAPEIARRAPGAVILIAGDGELKDELHAQVKKLGVGGTVKFVGFQNDVARLLAAADVFLLPSFLELHSISVLEALSLGVPVVCSSGVGCHDQMFREGENALLRDPFQDEGWAEAVVSLLKDSARREKIGKNGLALCRELYDIRKTTRSFEELYAGLLD
jgi:glycosyltransferase involved in cell wall biosynthesis